MAVPSSPSARAASASSHPPAALSQPITRRARGRGGRPGWPARRRHRPGVRHQPARLPLVRRGGQRRRRHRRGAGQAHQCTALKMSRSSGGRCPRSAAEITSARASSLPATARCSSPPASASSTATAPRPSPTRSARSSASIADGTIPSDNPFVKQQGCAARDLVLRPSQHAGRHAPPRDRASSGPSSTGRRAATNSTSTRRGKNYGWPVITWGMDYSGAKIGEGTTKAGMEQPDYYWVPSIAPSGLLYYTGDAFPQWRAASSSARSSGRASSASSRPRRHLQRGAIPGQASSAGSAMSARVPTVRSTCWSTPATGKSSYVAPASFPCSISLFPLTLIHDRRRRLRQLFRWRRRTADLVPARSRPRRRRYRGRIRRRPGAPAGHGAPPHLAHLQRHSRTRQADASSPALP